MTTAYTSTNTGLMNDPAPAYKYETNQTWTPLPVVPVGSHPPINLPGPYGARSHYETGPRVSRPYPAPPVTLPEPYGARSQYETNHIEYYREATPIDRAYRISRLTNCMGGAPRLPGLLPCPYGTDAIACAYHAA